METTDTRLSGDEKSLLANMVGKTLVELAHDDYLTTNHHTYMSAWLVAGDEVIDVHCETEPLSYFGSLDDVAVVSIRKASREDISSRLVGRKTVADEIGRTIKDVMVYEDTQIMTNDDGAEYEYSFTAAIVFALEGTELVLQFGPWFSEDIGIDCGPYASRKIPEAIEDVPEEDRGHVRVSRNVISLRDWADGGAVACLGGSLGGR